MEQESNSNLLNAYLVVGTDALKRRTVMERLRSRFEALGDLAFNHDVISGETGTGDQIVSACNTLPFASDLRLVEVTDIEKLSKTGQDAIAAYLEDPCPTTVLAMCGDKLAKSTRLYKATSALGKNAVIPCEPMKRFELVKAVRSMAVGYGFVMTQAAAEKLVNLVGEDTIRIDSELGKLALSHRSVDPVNEHEVELLVARTVDAKPWELVDAFSSRDLRNSIRILALLPSESPYSLLSRCTARIRELMCAQSLAAEGSHAIALELGLPEWRVKNHANWARRFDRGELERILVAARDCEKDMKSGSEPKAAFKAWLVDSLS